MGNAWRTAVGELADGEVPGAPPWPSLISDDFAPIEFSVVLDPRAPEVRVLWEPQGVAGDPVTRLKVAQETLVRLGQLRGVCTSRLEDVAPLFLRAPAGACFLAWHGARLWPAGPSEFKVYLNPAIGGQDQAADLVQEALERLGLEGSWPFVQRALARPGQDQIRYLSLDLRRARGARLKLYVYHAEAEGRIIEAAANASPFADGGRLRAFYDVATGGCPPWAGFSPGTCLSFVKEQGPAPVSVTVHVPVRGYVRDDEEVGRRVDCLTRTPPGSDRPLLTPDAAALHRRAAEAVAGRALSDGVGLTTYLSLRSQGAVERVTAYLATEMFRTDPPRHG